MKIAGPMAAVNLKERIAAMDRTHKNVASKKVILCSLVKTHMDEVKKLMPALKRAKGEFIVKYLGVTYDDFRKEVWVMFIHNYNMITIASLILKC